MAMPPKKVPKIDFVQLVSQVKENNIKLTNYRSSLKEVSSTSDFLDSSILSVNEKFGVVVSQFGIHPVTEVIKVLKDFEVFQLSSAELISDNFGFSLDLCESVLKLLLLPSAASSSTSRASTSTATAAFDSSTQTRAPGPHPVTTAGGGSATTSATGTKSTIIFTPPCTECLECSSKLYRDHDPVTVKYFTFDGLKYAKRFNLKCKYCSITYKYDVYGSPQTFWRLYDEQRVAVLANDCVHVERPLFDFQCNLANHSWVSFMGFSESYNGTFNLPRSTGFGAKLVSASFFRGELENEMRSLGQLDMFQLVKFDLDREKLFMKIESARRKKAYVHHNCHPNCKAKGCGRVFVVDGIWKLNFPHCMYKIKTSPPIIPIPSLPNVCTSSPLRGKAFCAVHCKVAEKCNAPTDLHAFLKYCGVSSVKSNSAQGTSGGAVGGTADTVCGSVLDDAVSGPSVVRDDISDVAEAISYPEVSPEFVVGDSMLQMVDETLETMEPSFVGETVVDAQGTSAFINDNLLSINSMMKEAVESNPTSCNKDTGKKKRLQKWSRGHLFVVRAGGHIEYWQPLFISESPSQVFLILLAWLSLHLKGVPSDEWCNLAIVYDNMCHVDNMIVARKPLLLSGPWSRMWMAPHKCIDRLHIRNHVDEKCLSKYNPKDHLTDTDNTISCEQTFVWLSRFKKIVCAMPKAHHLFYLHRMVSRRNLYTEFCYMQGCDPVLPVVKSTKTT